MEKIILPENSCIVKERNGIFILATKEENDAINYEICRRVDDGFYSISWGTYDKRNVMKEFLTIIERDKISKELDEIFSEPQQLTHTVIQDKHSFRYNTMPFKNLINPVFITKYNIDTGKQEYINFGFDDVEVLSEILETLKTFIPTE